MKCAEYVLIVTDQLNYVHGTVHLVTLACPAHLLSAERHYQVLRARKEVNTTLVSMMIIPQNEKCSTEIAGRGQV